MRILSKSGRTPAVRPLLGGALVLSLGLTLGACGGISGNRSMYPTPEHMPVVEKGQLHARRIDRRQRSRLWRTTAPGRLVRDDERQVRRQGLSRRSDA
ncbi:hypothetical protein ACFSTD_06200 [Novosphingobium colocasiae]